MLKYQIVTVGLKDELLSHCKEFFTERNIELQSAINTSEAVRILEKGASHLLILDMQYLRNIRQSDRIINIRHISFIPIIILSDTPETDVYPVINAGADICYDSKLPPSVIALLLSAQLRRYTTYNNFCEPETLPFQVGDIAIDLARHLVWVRGQQINLFPREFSLLLYFMHNPHIVLTREQICKHAWKKDYLQSVTQSIHDLRQKIEPDPTNPLYIQTVYRVGYRFTGDFVETCDN